MRSRPLKIAGGAAMPLAGMRLGGKCRVVHHAVGKRVANCWTRQNAATLRAGGGHYSRWEAPLKGARPAIAQMLMLGIPFLGVPVCQVTVQGQQENPREMDICRRAAENCFRAAPYGMGEQG